MTVAHQKSAHYHEIGAPYKARQLLNQSRLEKRPWHFWSPIWRPFNFILPPLGTNSYEMRVALEMSGHSYEIGAPLGWVKVPLSYHSDLPATFSHYQWLYEQNETKIRPNGHVLKIPPEFGDLRKSKGPPLVHEIFFSHKYRQYGYQKLCLDLTKWKLKTKIEFFIHYFAIFLGCEASIEFRFSVLT